jgi:hypothetical protein
MTSTGASSDTPQQNSSRLSRHTTEQFDENLTIFDEDDTEFAELCEDCTQLDLFSRPRINHGVICIGSLLQHLCSTCPFCALVWDSLRLHWGSEYPLVPLDEEPTFYVSRNYNDLSLSVTPKPPSFSGSIPDGFYSGKGLFVISNWDFSYHGPPIRTDEFVKRKMIGSRLDIVLLRRIIEGCNDHGLCRDRHLEKTIFLPGFRLIDVIEARLVEITDPCDYFALSYVWGGSKHTGLQTTKSNLESLRQPSALDRDNNNHERRLPLTISDTIDLCRRLGQRYLWVDCLCIVQDDLEEKTRLIHGMGQVYENASLTIFAVSGSNADHGLAGVKARKNLRREKICSINTKAGALTLALARLPLRAQIEKSHWNTRGWTYQEQALSERRLYLTEEEAFFVCQESNWREGHQKDDGMPQPMGTGCPPSAKIPSHGFDTHFVRVPHRKDSEPSDWPSFVSAVSVYTRKDLSYPEDALYAFSGIYDRFASIDHADPGIIATQGILLSSFPFSLFWYGAHDSTTPIKKRSGIHNMKLSSWSWASWIGPMDFVSLDKTQSFNKTDFVTRNDLFSWKLRRHHLSVHCFVDCWSIIHIQRDILSKAEFWTSPSRPACARPVSKFTSSHRSYVEEPFDTIDQLLSILPDRPQLFASYVEIGTLSFVAPCFAYPSGMMKSASVHRPGQQDFKFPGTNTVCCVIQFDSADEEIHDLALIYYDGSFQALCIKTVDGVSTRVGLAVMSNSSQAWKTFIQSGLLTIEWKHIKLR